MLLFYIYIFIYIFNHIIYISNYKITNEFFSIIFSLRSKFLISSYNYIIFFHISYFTITFRTYYKFFTFLSIFFIRKKLFYLIMCTSNRYKTLIHIFTTY